MEDSAIAEPDPLPPTASTPPAGSPSPPAPEPPSAPNSPDRPRRSWFTLTRVLYVCALLLVLQYVVPYLVERWQYAVTRGRQRAEYDSAIEGLHNLSLASLSKAYQLVPQRVRPSVVHISVHAAQDRPLPQEFSQLYGPHQRVPTGQGSGVIMDPAGYVITNFHVVHGASRMQVGLSDGRVVPARIVGVDSLTDLALLKVDADMLLAAEWGDSEDLEVGAMVWAAGSPFGLESTITSGILSAKHRAGLAGEVYQDFLQTDAAVNPGNSGGPLVDAQGRVVGINTAILGDVYQGVSFAIPSSVAKEVYLRLRTQGRVARGWLGVQLREVREEDLQKHGLPHKRGALISNVIDRPQIPSPALQAGLRAGDIVLAWNGQDVSKPAELIRLVAMTEVGSTAALVVWRDGTRMTVNLTIAERPKSLD